LQLLTELQRALERSIILPITANKSDVDLYLIERLNGNASTKILLASTKTDIKEAIMKAHKGW
jgi:hypothetical protein